MFNLNGLGALWLLVAAGTPNGLAVVVVDPKGAAVVVVFANRLGFGWLVVPREKGFPGVPNILDILKDQVREL